MSAPTDFIQIMRSINIYRWIFIQNIPWLLSMRASNYMPSTELRFTMLDSQKCNGQEGIISNTVTQLSPLNMAPQNDVELQGGIIRAPQQMGAASTFLTLAQTLKRSSASTLDNDPASSGTLGAHGTDSSAQDIELQIILTNNQDLIYSASLTYDDLCQHQHDTFSHSVEWKDYFALLLDPTSVLHVKCDDPDVWSIVLRGDATNLSAADSKSNTTMESSNTATHIKFEYQLCKLVDEDMRRDAMQYLLFALVGMVETQHLMMKQLQQRNAQLDQKLKQRPVLQEKSGADAFPHQQNITSTLDTLKLKKKRSQAPLSTLRPFKRAKKARGAVIS